jgi:hypothetical protein
MEFFANVEDAYFAGVHEVLLKLHNFHCMPIMRMLDNEAPDDARWELSGTFDFFTGDGVREHYATKNIRVFLKDSDMAGLNPIAKLTAALAANVHTLETRAERTERLQREQ